MSHGDVWWYEHPLGGRRPILILTRDEALPVLNRVLGVPTTRTVRGIPTEVHLDRSDGMPAECALTLDNLQLIRVGLCTQRITELGPERMAQVCRALAAATACHLARPQ